MKKSIKAKSPKKTSLLEARIDDLEHRLTTSEEARRSEISTKSKREKATRLRRARKALHALIDNKDFNSGIATGASVTIVSLLLPLSKMLDAEPT